VQPHWDEEKSWNNYRPLEKALNFIQIARKPYDTHKTLFLNVAGCRMIFGRILGWVLLVLTVVMASADAVMALGPADYSGILTADVLTLLTGGAPEASSQGWSLLGTVEAALLDLPAWVVMGTLGTSLLIACRPRTKRYRYRRN
jgi:hypothetical protein